MGIAEHLQEHPRGVLEQLDPMPQAIAAIATSSGLIRLTASPQDLGAASCQRHRVSVHPIPWTRPEVAPTNQVHVTGFRRLIMGHGAEHGDVGTARWLCSRSRSADGECSRNTVTAGQQSWACCAYLTAVKSQQVAE
jgi:hypothetical protein